MSSTLHWSHLLLCAALLVALHAPPATPAPCTAPNVYFDGQCICDDSAHQPDTNCTTCVAPAGTVRNFPHCNESCSASATCSNRGVCRADLTCNCTGNFAGSDCSDCLPDHYGPECVFCTNETTCNGQGHCITSGPAAGECECNSAGHSDDCGACDAGYFSAACTPCPPGDAAQPCNGRGTCDDGVGGSGECACGPLGFPYGHLNYTGDACADPVIADVEFESLYTEGGSDITIHGVEFGSTTHTVTVAGLVCSIKQWLDTEIVCTAPSSFGTRDVVVTRQADSATATASVTYSPPVITSMGPVTGPTGGGTPVTVRGHGFSGQGGPATELLFNGSPLPISSQASGEVMFYTPVGLGADITVQVRFDSRTSTPASAYTFSYATPVISGVTPRAGPTQGNWRITITGSNLANATLDNPSGPDPIDIQLGFLDANEPRRPCSVLADKRMQSRVVCTTAVDVRSNLAVFVSFPGFPTYTANTLGTSNLINYNSPTMDSVTGCAVDTAEGTRECSPSGGDVLVITGSNFGVEADKTLSNSVINVKIGGTGGGDCTPINITVPHTQLTCVVPPGVGSDLDVVLIRDESVDEIRGGLSYSGPKITPGSLHFSGSAPTTGNITAASTAGGENVTFAGSFAGAEPTVVYMPSDTPSSSPARVCVADPTNGVYDCPLVRYNDTSITCTLSAGVGADLRFVVCVAANPSPMSADSISYPGPNILPGTLRRVGGVGSTTVNSNRTGGELIFFDGQYFTGDVTSVNLIKVTYGASEATLGDNICDINTELTTPTTVACETKSGSGVGFRFRVTTGVGAAAQVASGTDKYNYPQAPQVFNVSGCPLNANNGTSGCPTDAINPAFAGLTAPFNRYLITITGTNFFQRGATVEVGNRPCELVTHVAGSEDSQLTCRLPPGAGLDRSVVVSQESDGQELFSLPISAVSYAFPQVDQVSSASCNDQGSVTVDCPRGGQVPITLHGSNFGSSRAKVLISGEECTGTTHVTDNEHYEVTCTLPAGAGLMRTVVLVQHDGELSNGDIHLSYAKCDRGSYSSGLDCLLCDNGTYANSEGFASCLECPQGTIGPSRGLSACDDCLAGSFSNTTGATECTVCSAGRYAPGDGSVVCRDCPAGKFSDRGASACTDCEKGYYQPDQGKTSCIPCDEGTIAESRASTLCTACTVGKTAPNPARSTCIPCPAGYVSEFQTGSADCELCGPGTFNGDIGGASCQACPVGKRTTRSGAVQCDDCERGRFSDTTGRTSCKGCAAGLYAPDLGMSTCLQCAPGTYGQTANVSACTLCGPGKYQPTSGQTECEECPIGTFQRNEGRRSCDACPLGEYADETGLDDCKQCQAGRYGAFEGLSECQQCFVGTVQPLPGKDTCESCSPGTFMNVPGQTECQPCPAGTFSTQSGASECIECSPGTYSAEGASECRRCLPGSFSNTTGATDCQPCPVGRFASGFSAQSCEACSPGTAASSTGAEVCSSCTVGRFSSVNDTTQCTDCPRGKYQDQSRQQECRDCPAGRRGQAEGITECERCAATLAQPLPGQPECLPCASFDASPTSDRTSCLCNKGLFERDDLATNDTILCQTCPDGALCESTGITFSTLEAKPGWWRPSVRSLNFYRCLLPEHCQGGAFSECASNRDGVLCAVCKDGFEDNVASGECTKCPDSGTSVAILGLVVVMLLSILLLMYWVVLRSDVKPDKLWHQYRAYNHRLLAEGRNPDAILDDPSLVQVHIPAAMLNDPNVDLPDALRRDYTVNELEVDDYNYDIDPTHKYGRSNPPNFAYKMKILLSFLQVVTNLGFAVDIPWPSLYTNVVRFFTFFTLDFVPWQGVGCVTLFDFYQRLLVTTITPVVLLLVITMILLPLMWLLDRSDVDDDSSARDSRKLTRRRFFKLVIFTLFLLYPSVSASVLGFFLCTEVEGTHYLLKDMSTVCFDDRWHKYLPYAIGSTIVYPLGVPLVFFILLAYNHSKHRLATTETRIQLGFLYDAFSPRFWFFEMADMLFKLSLTSLITFFPTEAQLRIGMVIVVVYTSALLVATPYKRKGDDRLHLFANTELYLLLLAAHIFVQDDKDELDDFTDLSMSIVLLSLVFFVFIVSIMIGIRNLRKLYFWQSRLRVRRQLAKKDPLDDEDASDFGGNTPFGGINDGDGIVMTRSPLYPANQTRGQDHVTRGMPSSSSADAVGRWPTPRGDDSDSDAGVSGVEHSPMPLLSSGGGDADVQMSNLNLARIRQNKRPAGSMVEIDPPGLSRG